MIIQKDFNTKSTNDINVLIEKKITFFQEVIQKNMVYVQKNKISFQSK